MDAASSGKLNVEWALQSNVHGQLAMLSPLCKEYKISSIENFK